MSFPDSQLTGASPGQSRGGLAADTQARARRAPNGDDNTDTPGGSRKY